MATDKNDAIATRQTTAVAIPDYIRDDAEAQDMTLDFDQSELVIPRVAICQSLTPQRKRSNENYIDGLEEGMLFNTMSGRIYDAPLKFVVIDKWRSNIYFDNAKVKCRSLNGTGCQLNNGKECCNAGWRAGATQKDSKPLCTEFLNYLVYLPEAKDWVVLSFKSTGLKVAKEKINAKMRLIQGAPDFAKVFELGTEPDKNDFGDFFVPTVRSLGVLGSSEAEQKLYGQLKKAFKAIAGKAAGKVTVVGGEEDGAKDDDIPF